MTRRDTQLAEFLGSYEQALNALSVLGVRTTAGRLLEYRDYLGAAADIENRAPAATHPHQTEEFFHNALLEASEIVDIATLDAGLLKDHETLTKLRMLCKGPALPNPARDDPARNYCFEFSTAADAARRNRLLGFSAGDLEIGPPSCPVECKRVSSLQGLGRNLLSARTQLARRGRPGIIAADLTAPIRAARGLGRVFTSEKEQRDCVDQELTAYLHYHLDDDILDRVVSPMVLGVIFRHRLVGSVGLPGKIRTASSWIAMSVHDDAPLNEMFLAATKWLAEGTSVAGTVEHLQAALRAVDVQCPPGRFPSTKKLRG